MTETPILSFLIDHADKHPVSFHMPGHKGSAIYRKYGYTEFLDKIMDCDITEIIGADNLYQTEGILKQAQEEYAKLYNVKRAYLLINGTSGGLIAAILASVPKGGKIILARNCHKAIYNALVLGDIRPVYAYPEMIEEYGVSGEISVSEIKRCLQENPDASAVILPSPNYYGICSDIAAIAKIVHDAGKILIVDQAHGAHLKFFSDCGYDLPKSAEECGADFTVNSIHKTLASFTQSALLTYNTDRVDRYVLEDKLQMIMSTSPSYLLMASLDINADILKHHKQESIGAWYEAVRYFYDEAAKINGLNVIRTPSLDITKINLDMSAYGLTGSELEQILLKEGIYAELTTGNILMCMTGIGNTKEDMDRTLAVLRNLAATRPYNPKEKTATPAVLDARFELCGVPQKKERVPLEQGAGRICAQSIIPYPPGIPFICPGERITDEVITYIRQLRNAGEKVIGVNAEGEITIGCDE
ncbi:MAG TPA: aminotransferase class I/II-fold pyridoxal phosphate-dependent enzyme [Methanocorpusculum sp.]|nr:aminotransferase class I/II-fold pyridoxal phosphate-dependent enzyme [Methanocorpusculum sp.]